VWTLVEHDISPGTLDSLKLATLWGWLLDGHCSIAGEWSDSERSTVLVKPSDGTRRAIHPTAVDILEQVWLGEIPKCLASHRGIGRSTIAAHCSNTLRSIGCTTDASHASLVLIMAAHDARGISMRSAAVEWVRTAGDCFTVSVRIPDPDTRGRLSSGEDHVARLAIAGKSHVEIAEVRMRAVRTVANQMAAIFHKLGISGRAEMRTTALRRLDADPVARKNPPVDRWRSGSRFGGSPSGPAKSEEVTIEPRAFVMRNNEPLDSRFPSGSRLGC
jgi:DNA-binding CsgD family transcriptional regulator